MVLQNETAGGAGNCRGATRRDSDRARKPSSGISELDGKHPRLDALAATLVGTPHPRMVLPGTPAHHGSARGAGKMRGLRIAEPGTGSGRSGYLVQFRVVAIFHAGLAGENGGLHKILPDDSV